MRNYARIKIAPDRLFEFMASGKRLLFEGIPKGAKLMNAAYMKDTHIFELMIEHPSLEPVGHNKPVPVLDVNVTVEE